MRVQLIHVSQNAKTGPIPVSIIERASCWSGCALYENGWRRPKTGALALHLERVSRGLAGGSWSEFCAKVAALRPPRGGGGRLWRYAQAGDLPDTSLDERRAPRRARPRQHRQERHRLHPPARPRRRSCPVENRRLIAVPSTLAGFTVNLSATNSAQRDRLAELGSPLGTVLCPSQRARAVRTGPRDGATSWPKRSASGLIARLRSTR